MTTLADKIVAGRALLRWNQDDLAEYSGVSKPTIVRIEKEMTSPGRDTVKDIVSAFESNGILFTDLGVEKRDNTITEIKGDIFIKLLNDIEQTFKRSEQKELIIYGADERLSPPEVTNKLNALRESGVKIRMFVEEGNNNITGDPDHYRIVPSDFFKNWTTHVYANKVAINTDQSTHCLIFHNEDLAEDQRNKFEWMWSVAEKPKLKAGGE